MTLVVVMKFLPVKPGNGVGGAKRTTPSREVLGSLPRRKPERQWEGRSKY